MDVMIAVVMLDMIKLRFVVCNLLWLSFLNGVQVFNLLGQSVLFTVIWSLVYHFFWTHSRHGLFAAYVYLAGIDVAVPEFFEDAHVLSSTHTETVTASPSSPSAIQSPFCFIFSAVMNV